MFRLGKRIGVPVACAMAVLVSGCNIATTQTATKEGIGYRQARYAEATALDAWRACRDTALELDQQAKKTGNTARYLSSAQALEQCEANTGTEISELDLEERMRAYAVATLNYVKGGDIDAARRTYEQFVSVFGRRDLRMVDGASFKETMGLLLGFKDKNSQESLLLADVNPSLKSEIKRSQYWLRH